MDQSLRQYLNNAFQNGSQDSTTVRDLIRDGVKDFEQHGKRVFLSRMDDISVVVAWRYFSDNDLNIARGAITIPRYVQCSDDLA